MKSIQTIVCMLWCSALCVHAIAPVRAQDSAPDASEQARQLHRAAVDDFAQGAYARAVDGFIAADRLSPRAGFLFNIAKSYDALHDVSHALAAYRGYLREAAAAPDAADVSVRANELSAQRARDGFVQACVLTQPLGAQVFVDGQLAGQTPITIDLGLGSHSIALSLAGYQPVSSSVNTSNERLVDLSFPLVALEAGGASPAPAASAVHALARIDPPPAHAATDSTLRIGGLVSLGAGVVSLGAGIAFEVLRAATERSARRESVQTQFARDLDTLESRQTLARVFAGSGVALAAVGGVLLGLAYATSERKPQSATVSVACMPSHCQGAVAGAF